MSEVVRACGNCKFLSREIESWEMSHIYWYVCKARPQVENLKSFPFKKTKCSKFEPRSTNKNLQEENPFDRIFTLSK